MATSQDERVLSEGHPSCTPPDKDSLMECDLVEPLGCDMSTVAVVSSDQPQNISGDVLVGVEKSNQFSGEISLAAVLISGFSPGDWVAAKAGCSVTAPCLRATNRSLAFTRDLPWLQVAGLRVLAP
ncbi:hypothetical protein HN873_040769 [Arachis hypogaea]